MKNKFLIFLLCFFIITGGFSLQYKQNVESYHRYVTELNEGNSTFSIGYNASLYDPQIEKMVKADASNMRYLNILNNIFIISMIGIAIFFVLVFLVKDKEKIYDNKKQQQQQEKV